MPPIYILGGPTASGKTAAALSVAQTNDVVIINADAMQVYHELPILTAQPTAEEQSSAPHTLFGHISASTLYSAAAWVADAKAAIDKAHQQGKIPLLVGGTGMYLKSLMEGLSAIPDIDLEIRNASRALLAEIGNEAFHQRLAAIDPVMAGRLHPGDSQRMVRAYEVYQHTGQSLAEWQNIAPTPHYPPESFRYAVLCPPREQVYANCDKRFDQMIAHGALEEVERLAEQQLDPALPAMKALGVPELLSVIRGELPLDEARALAKTATRQYAKRQMTWFRNQAKGSLWLEEANTTQLATFFNI